MNDQTTPGERKAAGAPSALNVGLGCVDATMVKRLATQTTLDIWPGWVSDGRGLENLIDFAKAVAAFEREACAKVCKYLAEACDNSEYADAAVMMEAYEYAEAAIRERSNV